MKVVLDEGAFAPKRAHSTDAGLDLFSREDQVIPARGSAIFHTGVHVELPPDTDGEIISKSGLNIKHDITSTGLIDEGYQGEIVVKLYNHGTDGYQVRRGDKISQLVIHRVVYEPVELADGFDNATDRGDGGFGSTGR